MKKSGRQLVTESVLIDHARLIGFCFDSSGYHGRMVHKSHARFAIYISAMQNRVGIMYRLTKWYRMDVTSLEFMALREVDVDDLSQYLIDTEQKTIEMKKEMLAMTNISKKEVRTRIKDRYRDLTVRGIH